MNRLLLALVLILALVSGLGIIRFLSNRKTTPSEAVETLATKLEVPWALAFARDGRLFFTERVGRVNVIINGEVRTLLTLVVAAAPGEEGGLLGLALDPKFDETPFVYVYYTYRDVLSRLWNRVSRFTLSENSLIDEFVVLDYIPGYRYHDGGRIKFGPDGKLYITTGDSGRGELAQNLSSLAGKILRMNRDGSIPSDNPFPGSPVYSLGHRNPQGLTWHPITQALYETEHGPSGERGFFAHDEINLIEAGKNYGWPYIIGRGNDSRFVDPIYETGETTWAPSGATFYNGSQYPQWNFRLLVATLRGQHLRVVALNPPDYTTAESTSAIFSGTYGRLRDIVPGPDGYLYFATSNRDGRGDPEPSDDRILRIRAVPTSSVETILSLDPIIAISAEEVRFTSEVRTFISLLNIRMKNPSLKRICYS